MPSFLIFLLLLLVPQSFLWAQECLRGENGEAIGVAALVDEIPEGSTLFLGELHGLGGVSDGQVSILEALRGKGHKLDVAMEFFSYPYQCQVDSYRKNELAEDELLKSVGWGKGIDFSFYRRQVLFPEAKVGESVWAINAPRSLTSIIAKNGLESLTDDDKKLLPPNFEIGNDQYFERFRELMGAGHIDESKIKRYFQAQSVWDDTMGWQLDQKRTVNTQVVIVGEFHVAYGGGLPDRLKARSPGTVIKSISFINKAGLSPEELKSEVKPSARWGIRSNYICLVDEPGTAQKTWSTLDNILIQLKN